MSIRKCNYKIVYGFTALLFLFFIILRLIGIPFASQNRYRPSPQSHPEHPNSPPPRPFLTPNAGNKQNDNVISVLENIFANNWTESPPVRRYVNKSPSFSNILLSFDWKSYRSSANKSRQGGNMEDIHKMETLQEELIKIVTPYLEMEPRIGINRSCLPPPLTPRSQLRCQGHGNIFTGSLRKSPPPRVGILIQFGFDVDVLEIYLNEVFDVVDQFFLIESTRTHFRTLRKHLVWEQVKDQPRFLKFSKKVTHFVVDDADSAHASQIFKHLKSITKFVWNMEGLQENSRWSKFIQWNDAHNFFGPHDLLGFGDVDEIPSREMIHMMKNCELNADRFNFGIWFAYGNIHTTFKTDWPVPGYPYSLGDPTFWTLERAEAYALEKEPPTRMRGTTGKFLLGGIHMTYYGYLPFQIMRRISGTESSPFLPTEIHSIQRMLKKGRMRDLEIIFGTVPKNLRKRTVTFDSVAFGMTEVAILPWFYNCNRGRYPAWEGGHDTRMD